MDEIDGKDDMYGLPHIGGELNEQMRQAIEHAESPVEEAWTPEEEAELQSELAKIDFDDSFYPPDFNPITVEIDGEQVKIPNSNTFPMKLSIINKLRTSNGPPELNPFEEQYAAHEQERRYIEIAEILEQRFPKLYKRAIQLFDAAYAEKETPGKRLVEDETAYIYSQAYSAAAQIARQLDPKYDLGYLYK